MDILTRRFALLSNEFEDELCCIACFISDIEGVGKEKRGPLKLLKEWPEALMKPHETYAIRRALKRAFPRGVFIVRGEGGS